MTRPGGRLVLLLVSLLGLGGTAVHLGLADQEVLAEAVARWGVLAPVVAVFGSAVLSLVMVPRAVLALSAGLVFGTAAGSAYVLVGTLVGAMVAFAAGRVLGREWIAGRLNASGLAGRLDRWVARHGLAGVLTARLLPFAPSGLTSYAFGLSAVRFTEYVLGTALGTVPGTIAYAAVGASVGDLHWPTLVGAVTAALLLASLGLVTTRVPLGQRQRGTGRETGKNQ